MEHIYDNWLKVKKITNTNINTYSITDNIKL